MNKIMSMTVSWKYVSRVVVKTCAAAKARVWTRTTLSQNQKLCLQLTFSITSGAQHFVRGTLSLSSLKLVGQDMKSTPI